jgi:hypothetical protein
VLQMKATTEGQLAETVREEELEQTLEAAQEDEEENEHSEEWLNISARKLRKL